MSRRPPPRSRYDYYSSSSSSGSDYSGSDSDDDSDEHVVTIDLDNTKLAQSVLAAKRTITSDFGGISQTDAEELRIAATVLSLSEEDRSIPIAKIVTTSPNKQDEHFNKETAEHWLHLKSDCVSFERFRRIALNFALRHQIECVTTLIYLLQRVQDDHERTSAYGSYIRPGTALRCDGKDRKQPGSATVSVNFISYPYFDVVDGKWPEAPKDDSLHLSRGLFQQHYPQEVAHDRDREQSFHKFKKSGTRTSKFLRVPQLWVLILNSSSIITCGPSGLTATFHGGIEYVKEEVLLLGAPSLIQVSAEFANKTTFYLPLQSCKTFFALKSMIQEEYLEAEGYHIDNCVLHTLDNPEELDAARWPELMQIKHSFSIHIRVSLRRQTEILAINAPQKPLAIQYTDLSSDEDENKALTILTHDKAHTLDPKNNTWNSIAANGHICQKDDTKIASTSSAPTWRGNDAGDKPKIFRRPTGNPEKLTRNGNEYHIIRAPSATDALDVSGPAGTTVSSESSAPPKGRPLAIGWHSTYTQDADVSEESSSALDSDTEHEILRSASIESRRTTKNLGPNDTESMESGQSEHSESIDLEPRVRSRENRQSFGEAQDHAEWTSISTSDDASIRSRRNSHSRGRGRYQWVESDDDNTDEGSVTRTLKASMGDVSHSGTYITSSIVPSYDDLSERSRAPSLSVNPLECEEPDKAQSSKLRIIKDSHGQHGSATHLDRPGIYQDVVAGAEASSPEFTKRQNSPNQSLEALDQRQDDTSRTGPRILGDPEGNDAQDSTMAKPLTDLTDEMRRTIREELRKEKDEKEFQQRYELEFRKRLGHFGFQDNQIDAMLHPDHAKDQTQNTYSSRFANAPTTVNAPTYIKVHRDHLDVETLHYYDIPYEWDEDRNYIIVLREMTERETEVLFEHTRRLRKNSRSVHTSRPNRNRKPEHESVRRKNRASKNAYLKAHGSQSRRAQNTAESRSHAGAKQKASYVQTRPDAQDKDFVFRPSKTNQDLRVPPFLAWPTTFGDGSDNLEHQLRDDAADRTHPNSLLIQLTLLSIDRRIYQVPDDPRGIGFRAASLVVWKKGNDQVTIPELLIPRKSLDDLIVSIGPTQLPQSPTRLQKLISHVRDYFKADFQGINNLPTEETGNSPLEQQIKSRDVLLWQIARLCVLRDCFVHGIKELIAQFVPKYYSHPLVERCWGSISRVDEILTDIFHELRRHLTKDRFDRSPKLYVVRATPSDNYSKTHALNDLSLPISSCATCSGNYRYFDIEDARKHLRDIHTTTSDIDGMQNADLLAHWITTTVEAEMEDKAEQFCKLLQVLGRRVNRLLSRAVDMRQSVANESQELEEGYLLPSALVKAAEKIFQFVYYAAFSLNALHDSGYAPSGPGFLTNSWDHRNDKTGAEMFATVADIAMAKARDDLLLMTHTSDDLSSMVHIRSSPQMTILLGLMQLAERPLMWDMTVIQLYRSHLTALRFEASRKPSKRVLRELYLLDEEIEIVASVCQQQYKTLHVLLKVLNTEPFKFDQDYFIDPSIEKEISEFRNDLEKTAKALRHNIEITEEGNSKAILIFTLVTIIFLPLSFVSSVFGMNTTDIRDMNSDQTLFWAIALPVTATIGGLSLITAYGGVAIAEGFHQLANTTSQRLRRRTTQSGRAWHRREKRKSDEEKANASPSVATKMHKRRQDFQHYETDLRFQWSTAKSTSMSKHSKSFGREPPKRSATSKTSQGTSKQKSRTVAINDSPRRSAEGFARRRGGSRRDG